MRPDPEGQHAIVESAQTYMISMYHRMASNPSASEQLSLTRVFPQFGSVCFSCACLCSHRSICSQLSEDTPLQPGMYRTYSLWCHPWDEVRWNDGTRASSVRRRVLDEGKFCTKESSGTLKSGLHLQWIRTDFLSLNEHRTFTTDTGGTYCSLYLCTETSDNGKGAPTRGP